MDPNIFFRPVEIDPFSSASVRLTICSGDVHLGTATGCFYKGADRTYLISNWHVFSGRNRYTGRCIDRNGCEPTHFDIRPAYKKGTSIPMSSLPSLNDAGAVLKSMKEALTYRVQLKNGSGENLWFQHAELGQRADIAGIIFDEGVFGKSTAVCVNEIEDKVGRLGVSESVFIVGFIDVVKTENGTPIWKKASVASEPAGRVDGEECFLVDARTQSGMSGSPVYRRPPLIGNSISVAGTKVGVPHTEFVGVYSGRHKDPTVGASVTDREIRKFMEENYLDLGFVWPEKLVSEMITNRAIGNFELAA